MHTSIIISLIKKKKINARNILFYLREETDFELLLVFLLNELEHFEKMLKDIENIYSPTPLEIEASRNAYKAMVPLAFQAFCILNEEKVKEFLDKYAGILLDFMEDIYIGTQDYRNKIFENVSKIDFDNYYTKVLHDYYKTILYPKLDKFFSTYKVFNMQSSLIPVMDFTDKTINLKKDYETNSHTNIEYFISAIKKIADCDYGILPPNTHLSLLIKAKLLDKDMRYFFDFSFKLKDKIVLDDIAMKNRKNAAEYVMTQNPKEIEQKLKDYLKAKYNFDLDSINIKAKLISTVEKLLSEVENVFK